MYKPSTTTIAKALKFLLWFILNECIVITNIINTKNLAFSHLIVKKMFDSDLS
jgi:hypothetical protein